MSKTNFVYELPHEKPKGLKILRNWENSGKSQNLVETMKSTLKMEFPSTQCPFQIKNIDNSNQKLYKKIKVFRSYPALRDLLNLIRRAYIYCSHTIAVAEKEKQLKIFLVLAKQVHFTNLSDAGSKKCVPKTDGGYSKKEEHQGDERTFSNLLFWK